MVKRVRSSRRRSKLALGAVLALVFVGVAYAAWTVTAGGPSAASVGSVVAPTITVDTTASATNPLYPGQTGPLYLKVNNTNSIPLYLATSGNPVNLTTPTVDGAHVAGCPASNFVVAAAYFSPVITIPANANTAITIPGAVTLNANAPTACQGATLTVTIPNTTVFSTASS